VRHPSARSCVIGVPLWEPGAQLCTPAEPIGALPVLHVDATAFEPQPVNYSPRGDQWDRLPWLVDEPVRVRRKAPVPTIRWLLLLFPLEAAASYAAGRISVHATSITVAERARPETSEGAQMIAERLMRAEDFAWQRRRPNAPY
jgi:hypothetical protein